MGVRGNRPPVGLLLGLTVLGLGMAVRAHLAFSQLSYQHLAQKQLHNHVEATMPASEIPQQPHLDWEALWSLNPAVCGWIQVEGTSIDLPVVRQPEGARDFYLSHDLWGNPSLTGVPFLDHRSAPEGPHWLVFGHHLLEGGQFSELQLAYQQDVFESLGDCLWYLPGRPTLALTPLCAMRVTQDYAPIQRFSYADAPQLDAWLERLAREASATSADAPNLCANARAAVTLVTCSSNLSGQPWRTLVIFVTPDSTS